MKQFNFWNKVKEKIKWKKKKVGDSIKTIDEIKELQQEVKEE